MTDKRRRPSMEDGTDRLLYWLVATGPIGTAVIAIAIAAFGALVAWLLGANTFREYCAWTLAGTFLASTLILGAITVRFRGRNLVAEARTIEAIRILPWDHFEELVAQTFRMKGWDAYPTQREGDGGADIVLKQGRRRALVQCKSWRKFVGVDEVRAFYGVMTAEKVKSGFFVTTSDFWPEAERFAASVGIELVRGSRLVRNIKMLTEDSSRLGPQ